MWPQWLATFATYHSKSGITVTRRDTGLELYRSKKVYSSICRLLHNVMAGARGIEPRS